MDVHDARARPVDLRAHWLAERHPLATVIFSAWNPFRMHAVLCGG